MNLTKLREENKAVAMVGFSSRHRELAPFDDPNIEIWGLNKLHAQEWFKRCDRMFQLHPIKYIQNCIGLSEIDRQHYEWLTQKHDFPIYAQKKYKEFPSSVEYPIKKMRAKFGDFYTSTLAYMMALALDEGFTHFELYGFDMEADTEYKHQRDSSEYFIGLAEGLGHTVYLPSNCSLLKGEMYAYESTEVGFRQLLENRIQNLNAQFAGASAKFNEAVGRNNKLLDLVEKYPDLNARLDANDLNMAEVAGLVNTVSGAQKEVQEIIRLFDAHYNGMTASGGSNGT